MTDDPLEQALRTAGHVDAADSLRDKQLANQLREAGHETLADTLVNGTATPPASEPESESLSGFERLTRGYTDNAPHTDQGKTNE